MAATAAIAALPFVTSPATPRRRREAVNLLAVSFLRNTTLQPPPRRLLAVKVAGADPKTVNGNGYNGINGNGLEMQNSPAMKELIRMYKQALDDGDEAALRETEAAICALEIEKNALSAKFDSTIIEIASSKEKFLRLNADFDNFRKQTEKDRSRFSSDIQVELVETLLPLVDTFESTKQQITPETDKEKTICGSYQGIYKQLVETLRSLGVGVVETVGKQFDPMVHEAVGREESQVFKSGIVSQEVTRGFVLKGRVVKPAKVKVSNGARRPTDDAPS